MINSGVMMMAQPFDVSLVTRALGISLVASILLLWHSEPVEASDESNVGERGEHVELREALLEDDRVAFERLLGEGADPLVLLDDSQQGWTYCAATAPGREDYLSLLIEMGYDVNFRQEEIAPSISLPLACAVRYTNLEAVKILVGAGALPTLPPSTRFPDRIPSTIMAGAVIVNKFEIASWLLAQADYSDNQLRAVVDMLQDYPYNESAPGNEHRLHLAQQLRDRGYDVEPWTADRGP